MPSQITLVQFDKAVLSGTATWWEMELPSGKVVFGENKAKLLGYSESKFKTYQDFMDLIHPDDYSTAMQAMQDHLDGKKSFYETTYRIKHRDGQYLTFYDCGQIISKIKDRITVIGFVMKIDDKQEIENQMADFKKLILTNNPSMVDLISQIK